MQVENMKILMGYVHRFDYKNEQEAHALQGHPLPGRVYRLIKDDSGYRLHIGRENNMVGIDGWLLGKRLKNSLRAYSFEVEVITPDNFEELNLHPDDVTRMVTWLNSKNKDLLDYLNHTDAKAVPTDMLEQLRDLLLEATVSDMTPAEISDVLPSLPLLKAEAEYSPAPSIPSKVVFTDGTQLEFADRIEQVVAEASAFRIFFNTGSTCIYPMMHVLYIQQG